jgi:hypothetical protein
MTAEELSVIIKAEVDEGLKAMQDTSKAADDVESAMFGAQQAMNLLNQASDFLGKQLSDSVAAFSEQESVSALLANTLRSTGNSVGYTAKELEGMAAQMMKTTSFDDAMIEGGQMILLRYNQIGHDVLPKATKAMLDMAAGTKTSTDAVAMQIGKLLSDADAMTAAKRVGIIFTDEQIKLGKELQASGQMAKYQEMVLGELEKRFGGAAGTLRDTFGGSLEALKNNFGELQESVGEILSQALKPLIDVANWIIDGFLGLDDWIKKIIVTFGGMIAIAGPLILGIMGIDSAIKVLSTAMATNPIMLIITAAVLAVTAIVGLVSAMSDAAKKTEEMRAAAKTYAETMKEVSDEHIKLYQESRKTAGSLAEKQAKDLEASKKWAKEQLEVQKKFHEASTEGYKLELEKLKNQYDEYKKHNVDKLALDKWYAEEKKKIMASGVIDVKQNYQELTDANYSRAMKELEIQKADAAAFAGINQEKTDADKKQLEDMKAQRESFYSSFTNMAIQSTAQIFESFGEALVKGQAGWADLAKVAVKSISKIIEALAQQAFVESLASFAMLNFAGGIAWASAAAAGFVAAGVVSALADMISAKEGADFTTNGPQLMLVGDNPGGREHVRVTPSQKSGRMGSGGDFIVRIDNVNNDVDLEVAMQRAFIQYRAFGGRS